MFEKLRDCLRPSSSRVGWRDKRGTWPQALLSLAGAVLTILFIRWAFFEPYVIPSGSMIPTLLVHDHILVNKFSYGIRLPFSSSWLIRFADPQRGDVVVFRSVENDDVFVVKRVVGLPGDEIQIGDDGLLMINGEPVSTRHLGKDEAARWIGDWTEQMREEYLSHFEFFEETLDGRSYVVIHEAGALIDAVEPFRVPEGELFMMGDNRENSSDSRVWGTVPISRVLGRAFVIWLSCEETLQNLPGARPICDPQALRWKRMARLIK